MSRLEFTKQEIANIKSKIYLSEEEVQMLEETAQEMLDM